MSGAVLRTVVHVAPVEISLQSGMGRVAWHWRSALRARGVAVHHVGPTEVGRIAHQALMPQAAARTSLALWGTPDLYMVHEPLAGAFLDLGAPVIVVSHGLERRHWEQRIADVEEREGRVSMKTRLLFPAWRIAPSDAGLRRATRLFLINQQDRAYAQRTYGRKDEDIFVFPNGADPVEVRPLQPAGKVLRVVFNGSWIARKGTSTLVRAAVLLHSQGTNVKWRLMGTGISEELVRRDWPGHLQADVEVIPRFDGTREMELLQEADVVVLPSLFEGMPLALLQAMAAGVCPVASDCCGQRDVIRSGDNGFLHAPGDETALARHLESLARNPGLRLGVSRRAAESVKHLSWDQVSARVAGEVLETFRVARR